MTPGISILRDISHMHKYETRSKCAMDGVQSEI
jgi:hypothetical protein